MDHSEFLRLWGACSSLITVIVDLVVLGFTIQAMMRQVRPAFVLVGAASVLSLLNLALTFALNIIPGIGQHMSHVQMSFLVLGMVRFLLWAAGTILLLRDAVAAMNRGAQA